MLVLPPFMFLSGNEEHEGTLSFYEELESMILQLELP